MTVNRNVIEDLDELPDDPRLGLRLIGIGALIVAFRYAWQYLAPTSFQVVGGWVFRHSPSRYPSPNDLSGYLLSIAAICAFAGAFIFFRRGFWWYAERRSERSITELKFK